jgi:hypothetical protein
MTRPLTDLIADKTALPLITDALRAEASRRQRAAMRAAGELEADVVAGTITDKRPTAVRITKVLSEAAVLVDFAEALEAWDAELEARADVWAAKLTDPPTPEDSDGPADELALAAAEELGIPSALEDEDDVDPEEVLSA